MYVNQGRYAYENERKPSGRPLVTTLMVFSDFSNSLCTFILFKLNLSVRGMRFESIEAMKQNAAKAWGTGRFAARLLRRSHCRPVERVVRCCLMFCYWWFILVAPYWCRPISHFKRDVHMYYLCLVHLKRLFIIKRYPPLVFTILVIRCTSRIFCCRLYTIQIKFSL